VSRSAEFELLVVINSAQNAKDLRASLVDAGGQALISEANANEVLAARAAANGAMESINELNGLTWCNAAFIRKLVECVRGLFELKHVRTSHPVLLSPVRFETRFEPPRPPKTNQWNLLVRIYPDDISVDQHDARLTQTERAAGERFWKAFSQSEVSDSVAAWRRLVQVAGPERAAWIKQCFESGGSIQTRPDDTAWQVLPKLAAMPERFVIYAYRSDGSVLCRLGKAIRQGLTYTSDPGGGGLLRGDAEWVSDFNTAVDAGMALRIPLTDERDHTNGFERLVVVGVANGDPTVGAQALADLMDHHHYSDGLGFVPYGTPTNNTEAAKSGHSDSTEDREASYDIEVVGAASASDPRANASRLISALGLSSVQAKPWAFVANAGDTSASYAEELQTALWPATGDYVLRYLLPSVVSDDGLSRLAGHFVQHVRAAGPLPSIRVGKQPYGVLPVCAVRNSSDSEAGWAASTEDNGGTPAGRDFDAALHGTLMGFHNQWLTWARDAARVPRIAATNSVSADDIKRADEMLLAVLAMEPHSVEYRQRPFVAEGFVSWLLLALRKRVFDSIPPVIGTPFKATKIWFARWDEARLRKAGRLSALTGVAKGTLAKSLLLRMFGWGNNNLTKLGFTEHLAGTKSERPIDYLLNLANQQQVKGDSKTLLRELLSRSLKLAQKSAIGLAEVQNALRSLTGPVAASSHDPSAVLHFFNTVQSPEQIVQRIVDDPTFGTGGASAYGVRRDIAVRILEARAKRPGKAFSSLQEIDDVRGVGKDTMHDILQMFPPRKMQADIDTLFRQTLDLCSHRVDAWVTSLATKRLRAMRMKNPTGIYLGAYGYVENLVPETGDRGSAGFIHTPSLAQAKAAAVLHSAYLTHDYDSGDSPKPPPNPARLNLTSARVRHALQILEGIRNGQPLGAILGYQFEKRLTEHGLAQYLDEFRAAFPIVANKRDSGEATSVRSEQATEAIAARNVVDGLALARWHEDSERQDITPPPVDALKALNTALGSEDAAYLMRELDNLLATLDGLSDLMLYEGVYHATQGNYDRAGAALDVLAGGAFPSQIESMSSPVAGNTLGHRVCLLFPQCQASDSDSPRARAEPSVAAWFDGLLGSTERIGLSFEFQSKRLNLNEDRSAEALRAELKRLPGMAEAVASRIADGIKARSPLKSLDDLRSDLKDEPLAWEALTRWTWTSGEAERPFYDRVDINSAGLPELHFLGLNAAEADQVVRGRPYTRVSELGSPAKADLSDGMVAKLQSWVTTGRRVLSLAELIADEELPELHLDPVDVLYLSATMPRAIDAFDGSSPLPPAGQTEVEQRVAYWVRAEFGLRADERVEIGLGRPSDAAFSYGLGEALELGRQVLALLGAGQALRPEVLSPPTKGELPGFSASDVDAFIRRVIGTAGQQDSIVNGFQDLLGTLGATSVDDNDDANLRANLFKASRYGVSGAIPANRTASGTELEVQRKAVVAEMLKRKAQYDSLMQTATEPGLDANRQMDALVQAVKALFGNGLTVLANYAIPKELTDCFMTDDQQDALLAGLGESRVRLWLQQAATVQPALLELEDTLITAGLWQQGAASPGLQTLSLRAAQLPSLEPGEIPRPWLALSDAERGLRDEAGQALDRANLSIVAAIAPRAADAAATPLVGLVLDQWEERIPHREVTTGLSVHFDGPSTQAPQSLLLAVPGQLDRKHWHLEELAHTVCDTVDLAKVRMVDPDAMADVSNESQQVDVGAILPALLFPIDRNNQGGIPKSGDQLADALRRGNS
jgi:DNA uptake protein ComE-like DNA-binding protein